MPRTEGFLELAEKIARLDALIDGVPQYGDGRLADWQSECSTVLRLFLDEDNATYKRFNHVNYSPMVAPVPEESHIRSFESGTRQAVAQLRAAITELKTMAELSTGTAVVPQPGNEIFVVHGHNEAFRLKIVDFLTRATGAWWRACLQASLSLSWS